MVMLMVLPLSVMGPCVGLQFGTAVVVTVTVGVIVRVGVMDGIGVTDGIGVLGGGTVGVGVPART